MMMRFLLAVAALILLPSPVLSFERAELVGFQNFHFGMGEKELRELVTVTSAVTTDGVTRIETSNTLTIDGVVYQLNFHMKAGRLDWIKLIDRAVESDPSPRVRCQKQFDKAFSLIKIRYGAPDQEPRWNGYSKLANFTFLDGGQIRVFASIHPLRGYCEMMVAYIAGSGGDVEF